MKKNIPVNVPVFNGNEKKYLNECIDTGWVSSDGPFVKRFEEAFSNYVGRKYAFAVCNGSAALEAAVVALDLPVGSEVIIPDFTIISCAQAVTKAGLIPVPVDCNKDDWNIDVSKIEQKITDKTKAIMMVHIYGLPCDVDAIKKIAAKYGLKIIEDAAEAHGLTYGGRQCGSFGDVSIFSFYPNKHIVCGEGGMVMTDSSEIADRVNRARNLFFDSERRYIHSEIGSNFRMTNMQAAIGLAQLEQLDRTVVRKREIGNYYYSELCGTEGIQLPKCKTEHSENIYWVFGIVIKDPDISADYVMNELGEKGIGTRHFFYPMHKQPALKKIGLFAEENESEYANTNYISEHGFYIPSGLGISREDQKYVVDTIKDVFKK